MQANANPNFSCIRIFKLKPKWDKRIIALVDYIENNDTSVEKFL
jgi:cupin superfamily acireductone dioxygenase involved in methionine salvage